MRLPAWQSCGRYRMSILPPVSVQIVDRRIQFIAGRPSVVVSTRLCICVQSKSTDGSVTAPPLTAAPVATPACTIEASHIPSRVSSPDGGNDWVSVHRSTSLYADEAPFHTW